MSVFLDTEKGSILKGQNSLPRGAYSFLYWMTTFQKGAKLILIWKELPSLEVYPLQKTDRQKYIVV